MLMLIFRFAIVFILFPLLLQSQEISSNESPSIQNLIEQADALFEAQEYELALAHYSKVSGFSKQSEDWEIYLDSEYKKAQCLQRIGQIEKAISSSENLITLIRKYHLKDSPLLGNIYHKLGVYNYINNDYEKAQLAYQEAIRIRSSLKDLEIELSRTYHNLGLTYFEKGNYESAIKHLRSAIIIRKDSGQSELLAQSYQELGIIYLQSGDYNKGLEIQEAALLILQQQEDKSYYDIGRNHHSIGILKRKLGDLPQALSSMEKALNIYVDLFGHNDTDVADCYLNIAEFYDELEDYEKALENYQLSLNINLQLYEEQSLPVSRNYMNIGFTHARLKHWEKALTFHQKSLDIRLEHFKKAHPLIANNYDNIADILVEQGKLEEALKNYQLAINNMFLNFQDKNIYSNPNLEKMKVLDPKTELLTFLSSKARTLKTLYLEKGALKDLMAAHETYLLCDAVVDLIRHGYESDASKLFLLENAIPVYEDALETTFLLDELSPGNNYQETAFRLMEKSKSVLLFSARQEEKAKWIANIPDSLLNIENSFKADIGYYQQQLQDLELDSLLNDTAILSTLNKVLLLKQDYQVFIKNLEAQFPKYHQEKYQNKLISLEHLKQMLERKQSSLVEYFVGKKNIYIFTLSAKHEKFFKVPLDFSFPKYINQLLEGIKAPLSSGLIYEQSAYFLYQKIWEPIESNLEQKVIIIPDGLLSYLPFEALLINRADNKKYKQYPYLLNDQMLTYAYSASVLMDNFQTTNRKEATRSFLGLAPVFKESSHFNFLSHSTEEVENIRNLLGGDQYIGEEASKNIFLQKAKDYKLIHISSHASALDSNSLLSWIAFNDHLQEESSYKLYLSELYTLQLNAELVVLSACETADGKLSGGEGVMSLARGFAFTGCQSIVTTLWQVNHSATSRIMKYFYQNLSQEQDKDEALHKAKTVYIQDDLTDQNSAHPFYWSSCIIFGNTNAISQSSGLNWWVYPLLIGVLIFLWYLNSKRKDYAN